MTVSAGTPKAQTSRIGRMVPRNWRLRHRARGTEPLFWRLTLSIRRSSPSPQEMSQSMLRSAFTTFIRKPLCATTLVCVLAGVHGVARAEGLPELGDASEASLSEPQERTIGKRIMIEIRGDRAFVEDAFLQDYITNLGNRLVSASRGATNENRREFEFFLLNDDTLNAFALLGGFIGTHSGLVLATQTESELAGVLGHEIAHILQRHQSRGAEAQRKGAPLQWIGLAAAILAARSNSSSAGQATEAALATTAALQYQNQLDYSREFERESDRLGIQIMSRAGFDPMGMVGFFERLQRANRHNDGKAPGYLRTHPLTTERIADMQNRVDQMGVEGKRVLADNPEYRLAQARLRVLSMGANEAVAYFRTELAQRTVLRNRADVYGLALALMRAREFNAAEKELTAIRANRPPHAWLEALQAEIQFGRKQFTEAISTYRAALQVFPYDRGLFYGYVDALYEAKQVDAGITAVDERLKNVQDDAMLYELAAKGYALKDKRLLQHRSLGEAYFRRGNLHGAVEQMEIAAKAKDGNFYEVSGAEARLRELKLAFRNRPLMPGEKRDSKRDKEDDEEQDRRPPAEPARRAGR